MVNLVFTGSPAAEAGHRAGDSSSVAVDGKPTRDEALDASVARIKGEEGTKVRLTVRKKGADEEVEVTLVRKTIDIPQTRTRMLKAGGEKVGYVRLYEFAGTAGDDVRVEVDKLEGKGAQWIVLDLRYNGGGLLSEAVDVTGVFQRGEVVSTKGSTRRSRSTPATRPPGHGPAPRRPHDGYTGAPRDRHGALKDRDRRR
jgi:carboxyl-terminal processing protease